MSPFETAAREHADSRSSKGTRYLYNLDLTIWLAFCEANKVDPARPTTQSAALFREQLGAKQKPLTVRRTLASLSSMYQAALDREEPLAKWNPFRRLPKPSADLYSPTETISDADAQAILRAAKEVSSRDYAIVRLLYDTGLRRASVAALKCDEIFMRDGVTFVRVIVKGAKRREVALPDECKNALGEWLHERDYLGARLEADSIWVFPNCGDDHLDPTSINRIVKVYAKVAGVAHAHPHRFRAAYVTSALDAGVPLHEVQASVHHSDPKTTLRYDRGQRGGDVSNAVAKFRSEK